MPLAGALHDAVDVLVDHVIDRRAGSRGQPYAQQAEDENIQRNRTVGSQQHADHRRKHDQ